MLSVSASWKDPPPWPLVTYSRSKVLSASMALSTIATITTGLTRGNVTYQNRCQALAPSILAASSGTAGSEVKPASRIMATMGVNSQTSTKSRVAKLVSGLDNQGWAGIPNQLRNWFANPIFGSRMRRHIMATATGVATNGNSMETRTPVSYTH